MAKKFTRRSVLRNLGIGGFTIPPALSATSDRANIGAANIGEWRPQVDVSETEKPFVTEVVDGDCETLLAAIRKGIDTRDGEKPGYSGWMDPDFSQKFEREHLDFEYKNCVEMLDGVPIFNRMTCYIRNILHRSDPARFPEPLSLCVDAPAVNEIDIEVYRFEWKPSESVPECQKEIWNQIVPQIEQHERKHEQDVIEIYEPLLNRIKQNYGRCISINGPLSRRERRKIERKLTNEIIREYNRDLPSQTELDQATAEEDLAAKKVHEEGSPYEIDAMDCECEEIAGWDLTWEDEYVLKNDTCDGGYRDNIRLLVTAQGSLSGSGSAKGPVSYTATFEAVSSPWNRNCDRTEIEASGSGSDTVNLVLDTNTGEYGLYGPGYDVRGTKRYFDCDQGMVREESYKTSGGGSIVDGKAPDYRSGISGEEHNALACGGSQSIAWSLTPISSA